MRVIFPHHSFGQFAKAPVWRSRQRFPPQMTPSGQRGHPNGSAALLVRRNQPIAACPSDGNSECLSLPRNTQEHS